MKKNLKTFIVALLVGDFILMTFSECSTLLESGIKSVSVNSNVNENVSNLNVSQSNLSSKKIRVALHG